jgi:hypothetical protein
VIDPYDFVFDTNQHQDWDACPKVYRKWLVLEDLEDDELNTNLTGLQDVVDSRKNNKQNRYKQKKERQHEGGVDEQGRIEVLEFHGNFRLDDGTYLRNWMIVVAGRKNLIRFEPNPYFLNPFTKECYEESEDGWGISPIEYIKAHIQASSILLSTGVEAAQQSVNPPTFAPEGAFPKQKKIYMSSGKIIDYKVQPGLNDPRPFPVQMNSQAPFPYLSLLESQAEATTGATRQLSGNVTTNDKVQTATEFQGLSVVGNLIIDRLIDLFNQNLKLVVVEKFSRLQAMINPQELDVAVENDAGSTEFKQVTQKHHYGNYRFVIVDMKSELERKQSLQEKNQFFTFMRQDPEIGPRLKAVDLAKEQLRDFG